MMDLSGVGIWSHQLRYGDKGRSADAAAELDELGYTALWIPDVGQTPVLDSVDHLLSATKDIVVATGILNLWMNEPADVATSYASLTAAHGDRFLMGIGVSHAPLIDSTEPGRYRQPLAATAAFLDALDDAQPPVPVGARVLAALGPKMLELAAGRSRGAHPYLVSPEHTRGARALLGDGPLLLPEQTAILTEDVSEARAIGTGWIKRYLAMPNYANSMLRLGFSPDDVVSVSDRLFDAIIVWGDEAAVIGRVNEHLSAGADHVCLQVLTAELNEYPLEQWRRIAAALR
jgi:probable F420-dependent oxidoreductase